MAGCLMLCYEAGLGQLAQVSSSTQIQLQTFSGQETLQIQGGHARLWTDDIASLNEALWQLTGVTLT